MVNNWGNCVVDGVPTLKCLEVVVNNIISISSAFVVIFLFIMLIIGAIKLIVSGGSADKIKSAKATLTYAFGGLLLFVGAYLILNIIDILFLGGGGKLMRFEVPEF